MSLRFFATATFKIVGPALPGGSRPDPLLSWTWNRDSHGVVTGPVGSFSIYNPNPVPMTITFSTGFVTNFSGPTPTPVTIPSLGTQAFTVTQSDISGVNDDQTITGTWSAGGQNGTFHAEAIFNNTA